MAKPEKIFITTYVPLDIRSGSYNMEEMSTIINTAYDQHVAKGGSLQDKMNFEMEYNRGYYDSINVTTIVQITGLRDQTETEQKEALNAQKRTAEKYKKDLKAAAARQIKKERVLYEKLKEKFDPTDY